MPPRRVEVRPHPAGVDLEPFQGLGERRGRAAGRRERARERVPLGLPRAGGALVLADEGRPQDGACARSSARRRPGPGSLPPGSACAASPTTALPRPLAPRRPRSARGARGRARSSRVAPEAISSAAPSSAIRTRFVCHGSVGSRRSSSARVERGDLGPALAERGERARRAAELRRQPAAQVAQRARASSRPSSQPAALSPKVVGTACWRSVRAAIGVSRCSRARGGARPRRRGRRPAARARAPPGDQHRGRVHHVLARRAEVHPARVLAPDPSTSARTSGSAGLPDRLPSASSASQSNVSADARDVDRRRGVGWDEPRRRAGSRERPLRVEHRGEPRPARHGVEQVCGDEQRRERRHTAKNVVCPAPAGGCRSGGRRPRRRRRASSARRPRATRAPDRSAFASTSSGK